MKKQLFINLGLAAVVLLLVMIVWRMPDPSAPSQPASITGLKAAEINAIRIRNSGGEFLLERQESGWRMSQPYQVAANDFLVDRLLEIADAHSLERFPAPAEGLAKFGLDPPQATLELNSTRIQMGNTHPINHRRYLRIDDQLHLIQDRFPQHLLAAAEAFVDLRPLPPASTITAIRTPDWQLSKTETGGLQLNPAAEGLSTDDLQRKLQRWQQAYATRVSSLTTEATGPLLELELAEGEPSLRFLIVKENGRVLLLRPDLGLAYLLPAGTALLDPPAQPETP
jgi:hypothetical protein